MRKIKQYFKRLISVIIFIFISILLVNQGLTGVEAKVWTKKSVQQELKKLEKETKLFERKYKGRNVFIVLLAGVIKRKPYIIFDAIRNDMFIVKNSKNLFEFDYDAYKAVIGVIQPTGKEKAFHNEYYTEVEALKGSKKFADLLFGSILLNQALKNKIEFDSVNYYAPEGEKSGSLFGNVKWSFPDDEYNGIKWEVKNKEVLSIDKKGDVTTKKVGKTEITARTTVSEKKAKVNFYVLPNNLNFSEEKYYFKLDEEEESYPELFLPFNRELPKGAGQLFLNVRTDSNVVVIEKVTDKGVRIRLYGEGETKLIVTDAEEEKAENSFVYGECTVVVE